MDPSDSFFRTSAFSASSDLDSSLPVVRCWRDGDYAVLWCTRCREYHSHGIQPDENFSPRVSHCDAAYDYVLEVSLGELPDAVRRDMKLKRPRGPKAIQ